MSKKKGENPYAITEDGTLMVVVEAIMHPMVPYADGITVYTFEAAPGLQYITVSDALEWLSRETRYDISGRCATLIQHLKNHQEICESKKTEGHERD